MKFTLASLCVLLTTATFGQFVSVKDFLKDMEVPNGVSMGDYDWVEYNNEIYFPATSDLTGGGLYKTDGTPEGTVLVTSSYFPIALKVANNKLFFISTATHDTYQNKLFVTDGTENGIQQMSDANVFDPRNGNIVSLNGILYFTANDGTHGYEVWRSDGTTQGTSMVKDILAGDGSSGEFQQPFIFHVMDNHVYFRANDATHGFELWKTDGTEAGTAMVADINTNQSGNGLYKRDPVFASSGSALYLIANDGQHGNDLWKSDGTSDGTVLISDQDDDVTSVNTWGSHVFFQTEAALYQTDGEEENVIELKDLVFPDLKTGFQFNDSFYFIGGFKNALWKTDGTINGTTEVVSGTSNIVGTGTNDEIIVLISEVELPALYEPHHQLWTHDGVSSSFTHVVDFNWSVIPHSFEVLRPYQDKFFLAYDDLIHGFEPAITDGTEAGTIHLADINKEVSNDFNPRNLVAVGSKLFFFANDFVHGMEPWVSNGTEEGTVMIKDINPGVDDKVWMGMIAFKDRVIFGTSGKLWSSDGTEAGTIVVYDATIDEPFLMGDYFFFRAENKIWKTDGVTSATIVKTLPASATYNFWAISDHDFVFFDYDGNMWKGDDTSSSATVVKEVGGLFPATSLQKVYRAGDKSFFVANDGIEDYEVWVTDGTVDGTKMVKDISKSNINGIGIYAIIGNKVIFVEDDGTHGKELWCTDGTANGTFMLKDINDGSATSNIVPFYADQDAFYFKTNTPANDNTIWKTDGTTDGTVQTTVLDNDLLLNAGVAFDERFFFDGYLPEAGWELWYTDFTGVGTRMAGEILEGPASSQVSVPTATDNNLFFMARDASHHYNLWKLDRDFVFKQGQEIIFSGIPDKKTTDSPFNLEATASSDLPVTFEIISGPATISGATITLTGAGTVAVKAVQAGNDDYFPAEAEQSFEVEVVVGLEDAFTVSVWPNPATSEIVINSSQSYHGLTIHDRLGRSVLTTSLNQQQTTIEVNHLPRGMYLVRLQAPGQSAITRKVLLK